MTTALAPESTSTLADYQRHVGEIARRRVDAMDRIPREVLRDERWVLNAARGPAGAAVAEAIQLAAAAYGIRTGEVGPCTGCRIYHWRYGVGGAAWCAGCLAKAAKEADERAAEKGAPR